MNDNLQKEIETLKRQIECLEEDYNSEVQITTEIMVMQEEFLDYLKEKMKKNNKNEKIYKEIIKEFKKVMI